MLDKLYDKIYTYYFKIKYKLNGKSHRMKYAWNPVFNLVMSIKDDYNKKNNDNNLSFENWLETLNNDKYNEVFNSLEISQEEDLLIIRYGIAELQPSMWTEKRSIFRECRSIVIDIKNDSIVICPFKKFFNLNEIKETNISVVKKKIEKANIFEITNKLDGSMHCARYYNNTLIFTGSRSINRNTSWRLKDGYSMLNENYKRMIRNNPHLTFIFEYISLNDAHVVKYNKDQEGEYLIGARDTYTGRQLSYKEILKLSISYNVKITKKENKTLEQLFDEMISIKSNEKEGWVLNIDGYYIKLKCDDYVHVHRLLDKYGSVNAIIRSIANGTYDDLISKMPIHHRERIEKISEKIFEYISTTEKLIIDTYKQAPKDNKKDFMIWVDNNCEKRIKQYVKNKYLGEQYNLLKKKCNGYKKLSDLGLTYEDIGIKENDYE